MLRVSVLFFAWSFSVLCLSQAHGYELPRALRFMVAWRPFGYSQSPIQFNLRDMVYEPYYHIGLEAMYRPARSHLTIEHENTLQLSFDEPEAAGILYQGHRSYYLQQFHFHSPPEHTFKQYPRFCDGDLFKAKQAHSNDDSQTEDEFVMEMHLVHQSSDGKIAVIGVLFKLGTPNKFLDKFWHHIPNIQQNGTSAVHTNVGLIDVDDLHLGDIFIRYTGSLTTPPYTEGVAWTVMCGSWNTISEEQLNLYKNRFPNANNRETQPRNYREVVINFPISMPIKPEVEQNGPTLVQSS